MGDFLAFLVIAFVIVLVLRRYNTAKPSNLNSTFSSVCKNKRIRLTNEQLSCLSAASDGKTVYGETPKFKFAQIPNKSVVYDLRTVNSLSKRGFLQSDGLGGFIKTDSTDSAIRSGMGF